MSGTIPAEAKAVHKSKHYQLVATANLVLHSQGLLPRAAFCIVRTSWQVYACKGKHRAPNNMSEACQVFATLNAGMHLVNKCLGDIAAVLSQSSQGCE